MEKLMKLRLGSILVLLTCSPLHAQGSSASSPPVDEANWQGCGLTGEPFGSVEERDLFREDSRGFSPLDRCWDSPSVVCDYPDREPLYSAGRGAPTQGSSDRCQALLSRADERASRGVRLICIQAPCPKLRSSVRDESQEETSDQNDPPD